MVQKDVKKRILIISDCPFFAGCESMIAHILNISGPKKNSSFAFYYRPSNDYLKGINRRIGFKQYKDFYFKIPLINDVRRTFASVVLKFHRLITIPLDLVVLLAGMFEARRVFFRFKPDIIHINNGGYPGALSIYAVVLAVHFFYKCKSMYVVNNIAAPRSQLNLFEGVLDYFVAKTINIFVTGSKAASGSIKKRLSRYGNIQRTVLPNGVGLTSFTKEIGENGIDKIIKRSKTSGRIVIAVVALLVKRKGHRYLLDAVRILKEQNTVPMPLVLIEGEGLLKNELIELSERYQLNDDIVFTGHLNNIHGFMEAVDLMILPSIGQEDFPNVVIEAMMHGKPVIGTNVAGIPEQIVDGETGFIVPPKEPYRIAQNIKYFIQNPSDLKRFGKKARERYNNNYTSNIAVRRYEKLYNWLMEITI